MSQAALALALKKRHEMLQLDLYPIRDSLFAGPRGEFAEQRGVSFLRELRLPALVAEVLQKIFDERLHQLIQRENRQPKILRRRASSASESRAPCKTPKTITPSSAKK